ncbi:MAG TPA: PQQ-binding-like beta-propeller repeat protein, partial [Bryobacteraceae bacterium]|nr:PQQ-binding-like beta-propeller repeat protein [Bryobacteraceae bacterium]
MTITRCLLLSVAALALRAGDVEWPVNGGPYNIRYTELKQITPENVSRLRVAWSYDAHDAFKDSEMQSNPIVVDGVLYATTPKLRVIALDATTGREIWSFDPNPPGGPQRRYRHRGVTLYRDRVFFTHRNFLWALDRKTGQPIQKFGDDGRVDLRKGLDRPYESLSVSASSPGVIFEDMIILGSTVPETLPGAPGDIRAYDANTGAMRWTFHTIPHPGE